MSQETEHYCSHCAAEDARAVDTDFRVKYTIAILSAAAFAAGFALQWMNFDTIWVYAAFITSIVSAGRWVIPRGLRGAAKIHLDINFLMTVAAFGALLIGAPEEGAAVMLLFYLAELLEEKAGTRVRKDIQSLLELSPQTVTIKVDGAEACIHVEDVKVGDIICVKPGERIGLDGEVAKGNSTVNQATITGESLPVAKSITDDVYAGTINQEGFLEIRVTRTSENTVLAQIVKLVEEARGKRSPTEAFVSRFSHLYTPVVVILSFALVIGSFLFGLSAQDSIYRGLTLLVISCPCAFAISIPVSMVSSIAGSARNGVLIKGSKYVESMSDVYAVAFDKTGTLTEGRLAVDHVCVHNGATKKEVLTIATALERMSEHPIAKALLEVSEQHSLHIPDADDFSAIPGRGLTGSIAGRRHLVGNRALLEEKGVVVNHSHDHECGAGTLVYVARGNTHLGSIVLSDKVRDSAKETVTELKQRGIRTVMLTGDNEVAAKKIAEYLGIDEYKAELLPSQKVEYIEELAMHGRVLMVGDGVNDAPAMAAADVGIAMSVIASDTALETADVALMKDDLRKIPELIEQSKGTMKVVRQNVGLSIGVKVLLAALAVPGLVSLWVAIGIGDMGLSLVVIANALRLATKR
ncbi:MAG: cadmium-translocating P-type ATPase [Candidatus Thorarchaeota archaeon]|nr:MAG: cadmium-translocating P-type ATPase [Candidatus Thorarchaeota archaeon]